MAKSTLMHVVDCPARPTSGTRVAPNFNHSANTSTVDSHDHNYCRLSRILCVVLVTVGLVSGATLGAQRGDPPLVLDSTVGGDLYQFSCASCHGRTGKGDGPAAPALKTPPPDLTALARQNDGAFPRDRVRAVLTGPFRPIPVHGSPDMPIWGPVFRALDPSEPRVRVRIESLVAYLESLQEPSSPPQDRGARLFRTYCASCHGSTARGDGPVAPELRRSPPDLTRFTENNGGVFPTNRVFDIIDGRDVRAHGDRDMPVWGDAFRTGPDGLTDEAVKTRIDAIAAYLRAIQRREAD
jgi:mono/diheme cytochrome c family protein